MDRKVRKILTMDKIIYYICDNIYVILLITKTLTI